MHADGSQLVTTVMLAGGAPAMLAAAPASAFGDLLRIAFFFQVLLGIVAAPLGFFIIVRAAYRAANRLFAPPTPPRPDRPVGGRPDARRDKEPITEPTTQPNTEETVQENHPPHEEDDHHHRRPAADTRAPHEEDDDHGYAYASARLDVEDDAATETIEVDAPLYEPSQTMVRPAVYPPQYDSPEWLVSSAEARKRRMAAARGRTAVRAALAPLGAEGFYVFEDLLTADAGAIDQLAIGPNAAHIVMVMPHEGVVGYRDNRLERATVKADPDLPDEKARWWFGAFEEDPNQVLDGLVKDLGREAIPASRGILRILCFTEAKPINPDPTELSGLCSVWDLADLIRGLDPTEHGKRPIGEQVDDAARLVVEGYRKMPWVIPHGSERVIPDLEDLL